MARSPIISQAVIDRALGRNKPKPKLAEDDIQRACTDLLIADGWRAIRTDPVSDRKRGKGFGEVGMPDYLYVRYVACPCGCSEEFAKILWIEYKAPGQKPRAHQSRWIAAERERGAMVWVIDSIEDFRETYAASGLARRVR